MTGTPTESEGSTGEFSVDEEDQLQAEDTLVDRGVDDVLDEGYSPVEKPYNAEYEGLDERLSSEVPDVFDKQDRWGPDDENLMADEEVGDARSGRLIAGEDDTVAQDVGIDGGAASAEEAAVHAIDPDSIDRS